MAVRGRKPKPTALKLVTGNPGKRRLPKREPKPRGGAPTCPAWLGTAAKIEWRRVAKELAALGILSRIDRAALAAYCQCYAHWRAAELAIRANGVTVVIRSDKGEVKSITAAPEVAIAGKMMDRMRAFASEFGMTPSSRTRVAKPGDDAVQGDPWARFG